MNAQAYKACTLTKYIYIHIFAAHFFVCLLPFVCFNSAQACRLNFAPQFFRRLIKLIGKTFNICQAKVYQLMDSKQSEMKEKQQQQTT